MNKIHDKTDQIDLNLLKVFEAVYHEQHLSRAAQSLHLTPSAVSHAIRRLRGWLDDPLFQRDGRRMQPTAVCLRAAPALLDQLARLRQLLQQWGQFDPARARQTFRIGVPDAVEVSMLPAILQRLSAQAPQAALASVATERKEMARALAAGQLDLVIDVARPISEPVRHRLLRQDGFCILARAGLLSRRPTLAQYLRARHVAVSTRATGMVIEDTALLNLGLQRQVVLRCQNYHSACRVLERSDYLLTMPAGLARQLGTGPELKHWPPPFELPPVQLHLYWHANAEFDPANQWLRQLIVDACA